jgi:hypothetical protein
MIRRYAIQAETSEPSKYWDGKLFLFRVLMGDKNKYFRLDGSGNIKPHKKTKKYFLIIKKFK